MPTGTRPDPDTRQCKLTFNGSYGDSRWTNVMWLYLTGSGEITSVDLDDLASQCFTIYSDNFLIWLNEITTLEQCQVVLWGTGDDVIEGSATGAAVGSDTGFQMPASVSACISWHIAPHYKGGHPRTYLPGISSDKIGTETTWDGGFVISLQGAAAGFHSSLEAIDSSSAGIASVEHGVVSFVRAGAWRTPPVFYRITGSDIDSRVDTQRRRLGPDR